MKRAVWLFALATIVAPLAALATTARLPVNERLEPVRPALERTVDQAVRDGLPSELIVSKVREGLAKGASPEAIRAAVERLAGSLADADRFLREHRQYSRPPLLVRALAEARTAGVELELLTKMVASDARDAALIRAVDALTDLALRGYPSHRAAAVVEEVLARDPTSVGRVVSGVEAIRVGHTVSRVDALEALSRNMVSSGSFDTALSRSLDGADRGDGSGLGTRTGQTSASGSGKKGMMHR